MAIGILDKMKNQSQKEMCDFHENEKGVIYCKTCKKNICINCVLTSTHQTHEKIKIEDAKLEIQLTNQNLIEKAKKRKDEIFQIYKKMNETLDEIAKVCIFWFKPTNY